MRPSITTLCYYAECRAECHDLFIVMLYVTMLSVIAPLQWLVMKCLAVTKYISLQHCSVNYGCKKFNSIFSGPVTWLQ